MKAVNDASMEQRDLHAYIRPVLKRWWLILAVVPIVTIGTYLYYDGKPKQYQASTQLYFQPSQLNELVFGGKVDDQSRVEDAAVLIQTSEVGERAQKLLADDRRPSPAGAVFAQAIEKSNFVVITATSNSPRGAARLANAYAAAFVGMQKKSVRREARQAARATERQLDDIPKNEETLRRREGLETQIQKLRLIASQSKPATGLEQVDPALPPSEPTDHDPKRNAIFAFVLGLLLAIGGAYGLEYLNRRISRVEDVEQIYGLPILTEVPRVKKPAPHEHGVVMPAAMQGPFQRLQANLDLLSQERPIRTILIASAAPDEGKSIVARNLAIAYREAGRNVAVLDADFRKPSLAGMLAADEGLGLADVLTGQVSFGQVVQEVPFPAASNGNGAGATAAAAPPRGELAMVAAGGQHGNLAMGSERMRQTLRIAADTYGTAIVDSPPLLAVPDVLPLLSEADAVVLVMRLGVSTRDSARRLVSELQRVPGAYLAGVVVNGVPRRLHRARSYGYSS